MQLSIEYVRFNELLAQQWHRNPKDHATGDIIESMKQFGFTSPILHDANTGKMVAGHGRLEAVGIIRTALETVHQAKGPGAPSPYAGCAGFTNNGWQLRGVLVDNGEWMLPVVRGLSFDSEDAAEKYVLADNRLTEMGGWREDRLHEIFKDWKTRDVDVLGTGFTDQAVRRIMRLNDPDRFAGRTPADKLDGFLDAELKQVVLYFAAADYDNFIDALESLAQYLGVDSNTAVIERLVQQAMQEMSK